MEYSAGIAEIYLSGIREILMSWVLDLGSWLFLLVYYQPEGRGTIGNMFVLLSRFGIRNASIGRVLGKMFHAMINDHRWVLHQLSQLTTVRGVIIFLSL